MKKPGGEAGLFGVLTNWLQNKYLDECAANMIMDDGIFVAEFVTSVNFSMGFTERK